MKLKYPKYYKKKSQQDYFKHLIVELENHSDVEVVEENEFSDLSINNYLNTKFSQKGEEIL